MDDIEIKDYRQSNKERMLLAILLSLGEYPEKFVLDYPVLEKKYPELITKAVKIYKYNNLDKIVESPKGVTKYDIDKIGTTNQPTIGEDTPEPTDKAPTNDIKFVETNKLEDKTEKELLEEINKQVNGPVPRISEKDVFTISAKIAFDHGRGPAYYKVLGTDDEKTCPNCKKWIGKIISMTGSDPRYPSYDEFINSHVFHPNCRCSLHPVKVRAPNIETLALNEDPNMNDTLLYTGFVDNYNNIPDDIPEGLKDYVVPQTYDFGKTLVQLTPFGTFKGWDGKEAVDEIVDKEACEAILSDLNSNPREILVDRDHSSCRPPEERDTTALAWASNFKIIDGLGNLSGLYCELKWTSKGRKLVEDRTYRFLSPVWEMTNGKPSKMVSIGLTNRPAIKSNPIINTIPEKDIDMDKDELMKLIKQAVQDAFVAQNQCKNEEPPKEEKVEEPKKEDKPEPPKEEPKKEEPKKEEKVEEPKKEEVIKEEVLNTQPVKTGVSIAKDYKGELDKLHGDDFVNYVKQHKSELLENW